MKRLLTGLVRLFTSYGLACVILALLCILTYLGTIAQVDLGIYEAQRRYFTSWIAWHPLTDHIAVPLPGVMLLMIIFSINLIGGGILRLRRRLSNIGMFVIHGGILFLLIGGLVTHVFGDEGQMTLAPGRQSSRFESYTDWELAVVDTSPADHDLEFRVPQSQLQRLHDGRSQLWQDPGLPFDVRLSNYYRNANVVRAAGLPNPPTPVIGDFFIAPLPVDKQAERNFPAMHVTLVDCQTGSERTEILWGASARPLVVEVEGRRFEISLRHVTWTLPFAIELEKFTAEFHPGTDRPRHFQSDVVKIDADGERQRTIIRMNEPLRTEGYVFFQASYQQDPATGEFLSTLAVTRNPADQVPLYACVIVTAGMVIHFGMRLNLHLKRERQVTA